MSFVVLIIQETQYKFIKFNTDDYSIYINVFMQGYKLEKDSDIIIDRSIDYIVINKSIITEEDKKILNMLYLPIIGPLPIMLYNMLLNDLDKLQLVSDVSIHAKLLSNLHISTSELMEAKNMLEAIGLLKTYIKEDMVNNYIYELYSPVSAHEF